MEGYTEIEDAKIEGVKFTVNVNGNKVFPFLVFLLNKLLITVDYILDIKAWKVVKEVEISV